MQIKMMQAQYCVNMLKIYLASFFAPLVRFGSGVVIAHLAKYRVNDTYD